MALCNHGKKSKNHKTETYFTVLSATGMWFYVEISIGEILFWIDYS